MNAAHVHLILNHIPIIAIPVALIFLVHSLKTNNPVSRRFAYLVLIVSALFVVPVYLTGEPAEEIVEHIAGVSEPAIEEHEEFAEIALIVTLVAGASAIFGFLAKSGPKAKLAERLVLVTSVLATLTLLYTANLGGNIRHTEFSGAAGEVTNPQ